MVWKNFEGEREMQKKLLEAMRNGKCVCMFFDESRNSSFIYGKIIGVDDTFLAMTMVTPAGTDDGILVKTADSVIRFEISGQYERKMNALMQANLISMSNDLLIPPDVDVLDWALSKIMNEKRVVSVELNDSGTMDVTGRILSIDEGVCEVELFDEYGINDGISYFRKSDITQISFDGEREKIIEILLNNDM